MMKKIYYTATIALTSFVLFSCSKSYYISHDFESATQDHHSVAIVPLEIIFMGKMPKGLTEGDIREIEVAESKAFQIAFYNKILQSTKGGKKPIRINVQHYDKTLTLLRENGITEREAWRMDPQALTDILNVDAVLMGRIEKHRLMSDLASYGIDLATYATTIFAPQEALPWIPQGTSTNKAVNATYSLINADNGTTLWSTAYSVEADWTQTSEQIINSILSRSSRNFPYRE